MTTKPQDLVDAVRAWDEVPSALVEPLGRRSTHALFRATLDGEAVVVKRFVDPRRAEHEREWDTLVALEGSGLAPAPRHRSYGGGVAPVVVMTAVAGEVLGFGDLSEHQRSRWLAANRTVHGLRPATRRPATGHRSVMARRSIEGIDQLRADPSSSSARRSLAAHTAGAWLARERSAIETSRPDDEVYCRGDTNAANYLWSGDRAEQVVRAIDFEDAGFNDPAIELADAAEHLANRGIGPAAFDQLVDGYGLERRRGDVDRMRRLQACFWLVLVERWVRAGNRPLQVTPDEQSQRVLDLLA